ncbi:hypothetical protein B0H10DRAFT_1999576 [Mycena sp. CBHHK59/15]|nr:hypothetical protein B0H10DRAFT_1999576 [Mycena sp. CBHHK59/15]
MSISGNITAFLGALDHSAGGLYVLWNYMHDKLIVVQTLGVDIGESSVGVGLWVEKIQTLIGTIDWERKEDWAYLITPPSGPRIIQRQIEHYRTPCDFLWAPRVDESEIRIQKVQDVFGRRRGVWQGKEVVIEMPCDDFGLQGMERETRGHKMTRGLDLTYELLAHIFRGDLLVGLLTEPPSKRVRPIRPTDRALVFAAFAKLERARIVHNRLDAQGILIEEGTKVRILNLLNVKLYGEHETKALEEDAKESHWDRLSKIFDELGGEEAAYGLLFFPPSPIFLPTIPSPEKLFAILDFSLYLPLYLQHLKKDEDQKRRRKSSKLPRTNAKVLSIGILAPRPRTGILSRLLLAPVPDEGCASIV